MEVAGSQLHGLPVVGGLGMAGTQLCAGLPEEDNRGAAGLGCWNVSWAGVAQVSGLLSLFLFLSVSLLLFVLAR